MKGVYYLPGNSKDDFSVVLTKHPISCHSAIFGVVDDLAIKFTFKGGALDRVWLGGFSLPAQYNLVPDIKTIVYDPGSKVLSVGGRLDASAEFAFALQGKASAHECAGL